MCIRITSICLFVVYWFCVGIVFVLYEHFIRVVSASSWPCFSIVSVLNRYFIRSRSSLCSYAIIDVFPVLVSLCSSIVLMLHFVCLRIV